MVLFPEQSKIIRRKKHKTYGNKLNRQFEVSEDTQAQLRVVCDITEWRLHNGTKVYLCATLELATRAVVGYEIALNGQSGLVIDVINQVHRNFPDQPLLFHSEQGSQFISKEVVHKIRSPQWGQSMSRKGNCWDNAVIESFFSIIKREELKWHVFHSFI